MAQFQIQDWASDGQVTQPQTIVQVMEEVIRAQQRTEGGPVVVHCRYGRGHLYKVKAILLSDTVGRSGVFCTAFNVLEQCKTNRTVDVFQATKLVRMHRPGAVTTLVSTGTL